MQLKTVIQGYWLDRRMHLAQQTINRYQTVFNDFASFVGADIEFEDITVGQIRAYLNKLADRGLVMRSVADYWTPLSALWTWAEREINAPHIIRGKVPKPKYKDIPVEPFRFEEIKRILKAIDYGSEWIHPKTGEPVRSKRPTGPRDKAIVLTLLDSGLRASELCALTLADYDSERGKIFVRHGKGNKKRILFLGNNARKAIWRYMATRIEAKDHEPLFPTREGRHIHRASLRQLLVRIGQSAGVENTHPHRFRHTFAVMFLRNGGNAFELQKALGHESMQTVKIYVNLAALDLEERQKTASPVDNWRL